MARKTNASVQRGDIVARLYAALDRKMKEIEERISASGEGVSAADAERDARTLTSLARLYEKLSEMEQASEKAAQKGEFSQKDMNADRQREEIAERLERWLKDEQD